MNRAEVEERGAKKEPQRSRVTENERGDANAGQTLNDFHCFQKLSYQRESPQPRHSLSLSLSLSVFLTSIDGFIFPSLPRRRPLSAR